MRARTAGGTRPPNTSISVPRLTPLYSASTSTWPGPGARGRRVAQLTATGRDDQNARATSCRPHAALYHAAARHQSRMGQPRRRAATRSRESGLTTRGCPTRASIGTSE